MKKNRKSRSWYDHFLEKGYLKITLSLLFSVAMMWPVHAQQDKEPVSLSANQLSLIEIFKKLEEQVPYHFLYYAGDLTELGKRSLKLEQVPLTVALDSCLKGTRLEYEITSNQVVVRKTNVQGREQPRSIRGVVTDSDGNPLPGATIVIQGSLIGTASAVDGKFTITTTETKPIVLVVSFIGYKEQIIQVKDDTPLKITLYEEVTDMEEVVVMGFFNKSKNSFTGSVKSISIQEIKSVSNTNLISALSMLTPGLKLLENNQYGSNPNVLPEIIIRGTSSLTTESDINPNQPLIILDGVQITLRDLYDIDINEIERVDVLKDASATALYGERAANGVIAIIRKQITNNQLRFSYNLDGSVEAPDLTSYDFLNAADKLEFERYAGLYNFEKKDELEEYNRKLILVARGVNTNWMSKPLRTGINIGHSVSVSGRGNNMTYRVSSNYKNIRGVMKEDYRNSLGLNIFLSYNLERKLTVSLQSRYTSTQSKNSPYGNFGQYVRLNPYDMPYGEDGTLIRRLSWDIVNPLYEALCGNFSKGEENSFSNTLSIRWDIMKDLYFTSTASYTSTNRKDEAFTSPTSSTQELITDVRQKGRLNESYAKGINYDGNFVLNYNLRWNDDYILSLHTGGEIAKSDTQKSGYTTVGFYKPDLHTTGYAEQYPTYFSPTGSQELSTRLGLFGNANVMAHNKYFVDASIRRSGASQFGANKRYAPFWSIGAGWNVHNEKFLTSDWWNMLRLRYSYGVTGNVSFAPYQAITTYSYVHSYLHGMGAIPKQMGNDDLTWQSTKAHNFGINADFWNNRVHFSFDYYVQTTDDLLIDLTIPPSVGESSVKKNLGKIRNSGYEFDLSLLLVNTDDWRVNLKLNGAHNENKILKISNALQAWNDMNNETTSSIPQVQYQEGESTTTIYGVRSAGINPATGREIFITKNGQYTTDYNVDDKVAIGDENPLLEGAIYPSIQYKGFSCHIMMTYKFGGQQYNSTRATNVEDVNPRYNVDRRAFEQRWKNINDVVHYLDIANYGYRSLSQHSSRFVEDDNLLEVKNIELSYELSNEWMKNIGFKRLRVGIGITNPVRISSIKYERGTSYPFSRGFSFSISPTF